MLTPFLMLVCTVCQCPKCPSPSFHISLYQQQSDVTATRIALSGFRLTRGLITVDSDNHVENYLKEMLAFVFYGSNVHTRPENRGRGIIQSTLVISNSLISNNRLSRSENLIPVLTQKSTNRQQNIVEKRSLGEISPLFHIIFNISLT